MNRIYPIVLIVYEYVWLRNVQSFIDEPSASIKSLKAVYGLLDNPRTPINFVISITGAKPVLGPNSLIPYIKKVSP